jgi:DNA-binding NarL/FixJ family response regulator
MNKITRIVIADDHMLMRQGLRAILEKVPDLEVVGEAENGQAAAELAAKLQPDIVLMDINMPVLNGIDGTRLIMNATPVTRIIALTMNADRQILENMLRAGANGFVLKDCAAEQLLNAIREVVAGRTFLCPEIASLAVSEFVQRVRLANPAERVGLTPAECNVLRLLASGKSNKEIAASLHISPRTVEVHRTHIQQKLGVSGVAELTKYAIHLGLTSAAPSSA